MPDIEAIDVSARERALRGCETIKWLSGACAANLQVAGFGGRTYLIYMTYKAPHRTLCLVAYDIREDTRRSSALRAVKAFGMDGQKSVHECALTHRERQELTLRLSALIDPDTDRIMVLPLDPRSTIVTLGGQTRAPLVPPVLVIA